MEKKAFLQLYKKNLKTANELFRNLEKESSFTSRNSKKIFYKTIQKGDGKPLVGKESLVTMRYAFYKADGSLFSFTDNPRTLTLQNTLPGLAEGMEGMEIGEKRVIYLHPDLITGALADPGICLKAMIEVEDVCSSPSSLHHAFSPVSIEISGKNLSQTGKEVAFLIGQSFWEHYIKETSISAAKIIDFLQQIQNNFDEIPLLTEDERDALNLIHFSLYFKDK